MPEPTCQNKWRTDSENSRMCPSSSSSSRWHTPPPAVSHVSLCHSWLCNVARGEDSWRKLTNNRGGIACCICARSMCNTTFARAHHVSDSGNHVRTRHSLVKVTRKHLLCTCVNEKGNLNESNVWPRRNRVSRPFVLVWMVPNDKGFKVNAICQIWKQAGKQRITDLVCQTPWQRIQMFVSYYDEMGYSNQGSTCTHISTV